MMTGSKSNKIGQKIQVIFFASCLVLCLIVLVTLPRVSMPLMFAYILYLLIGPLLPQITKGGLSRTMSLSILFLTLIFLSIYPFVKFYPLIKLQAQNFQYYLPKLEGFVKNKYDIFRSTLEMKTGLDIGDRYISDILGYSERVTQTFLLDLPEMLAAFVEWAFLVPLFLFFLVKDGVKFKSLVLKLVPNMFFERFYYLSHQFNKKIGDYIFAKFIEASIVGVIITLGLMALDVRFSILLGLIAAITNIIPYVGPLIGLLPAAILGLTEYGFDSTFGGIMILYMVANLIDMALVFPLLISKIVDLHPVLVILGVILGSQYLGILGMVISIPLVAALKLLFIEVYNEIYIARIR